MVDLELWLSPLTVITALVHHTPPNNIIPLYDTRWPCCETWQKTFHTQLSHSAPLKPSSSFASSLAPPSAHILSPLIHADGSGWPVTNGGLLNPDPYPWKEQKVSWWNENSRDFWRQHQHETTKGPCPGTLLPSHPRAKHWILLLFTQT